MPRDELIRIGDGQAEKGKELLRRARLAAVGHADEVEVLRPALHALRVLDEAADERRAARTVLLGQQLPAFFHYLRLALRVKDRQAVRALDFANGLRELHPFGIEAHQLLIDGVEPPPYGVEPRGGSLIELHQKIEHGDRRRGLHRDEPAREYACIVPPRYRERDGLFVDEIVPRLGERDGGHGSEPAAEDYRHAVCHSAVYAAGAVGERPAALSELIVRLAAVFAHIAEGDAPQSRDHEEIF